MTPLCSDNQMIEVLGGQISALFRNFLEVLIPGTFFYIFVDSGPLQVPIGSPNGPIWSTFGAQIRVN